MDLSPFPACFSGLTFTVNWSGWDGKNGSGIGTYTVYVSDNGGKYAAWLTNVTQTSAAFTGQAGHKYRFYSVATDEAGNVQKRPRAAQASTKIVVPRRSGAAAVAGGIGSSLADLALGSLATETPAIVTSAVRDKMSNATGTAVGWGVPAQDGDLTGRIAESESVAEPPSAQVAFPGDYDSLSTARLDSIPLVFPTKSTSKRTVVAGPIRNPGCATHRTRESSIEARALDAAFAELVSGGL